MWEMASVGDAVRPAPDQSFDVAQDRSFEEPVKLPVEDVLDLHAFVPKEIASVVEEYLWQCRQAGLCEVRLIHGKGTGTQRAIVRRLLINHPDVLAFAAAPPQAGGWGATVVRLKPPGS